MCAPVVNFLMRFYDLPFRQWALTPQNDRLWPALDTAPLNILASKIPLLEW